MHFSDYTYILLSEVKGHKELQLILYTVAHFAVVRGGGGGGVLGSNLFPLVVGFPVSFSLTSLEGFKSLSSPLVPFPLQQGGQAALR